LYLKFVISYNEVTLQSEVVLKF